MAVVSAIRNWLPKLCRKANLERCPNALIEDGGVRVGSIGNVSHTRPTMLNRGDDSIDVD
jgi:hypothetical protein